MAFKSGASAPPHSEPDKQASGMRSPTKSDQSANVGRFKANVPKGFTKGDTGKSGRMPSGSATDPLVTGRGAKR